MKTILNTMDKKMIADIRKVGYIVKLTNNGGIEVSEPFISKITGKIFHKRICSATAVYGWEAPLIGKLYVQLGIDKIIKS